LALDGLFNDLDDTYEETLNRISLQNKDDVRLANLVIYWITFAVRPLSITELQHALAVMDLSPEENNIDDEALPDKDVLVAVCAGIVIVDGQCRIIRLIHYTTQQFFERTRKSKFPTAQTDITITCLTYLSLDESTNSCSQDKGEVDKRMPLLTYAAQNWGKHASEAPDNSVYHEILAFLSNDGPVYSANHAMESNWQYLKTSSGVKMLKLVLAAYFGLLSIVEALLQQGEDINATGTINMTALFTAVKHKWKALAQLLLQNGADVDVCHIQDGIPLHMAVLNGDDTIVSHILEKHPNLEAQDSVKQTHLTSRLPGATSLLSSYFSPLVLGQI
jgi:hypothetical protein